MAGAHHFPKRFSQLPLCHLSLPFLFIQLALKLREFQRGLVLDVRWERIIVIERFGPQLVSRVKL